MRDLDRRRAVILDGPGGRGEGEGGGGRDANSGQLDARGSGIGREGKRKSNSVNIRAHCPIASLARYSTELRTLTSGAAFFSISRYAGYAPLPFPLPAHLLHNNNNFNFNLRFSPLNLAAHT